MTPLRCPFCRRWMPLGPVIGGRPTRECRREACAQRMLVTALVGTFGSPQTRRAFGVA